MTISDEELDAAAKAFYHSPSPPVAWDKITERGRETFRRDMRAAIEALIARGWSKRDDVLEEVMTALGEAEYFNAARFVRDLKAKP